MRRKKKMNSDDEGAEDVETVREDVERVPEDDERVPEDNERVREDDEGVEDFGERFDIADEEMEDDDREIQDDDDETLTTTIGSRGGDDDADDEIEGDAAEHLRRGAQFPKLC